MIIDIHVHYGVAKNGELMQLEQQLSCMKKSGIDYALISNLECGDFHEGIEGNRKLLDMVRTNKEKLGCLLWCCENLDTEQKITFEELYLSNQDIVKGLKVHPNISCRRADDECFDFFYQLGEKYNIPIQLHVEDNQYSKIEYVINVAKKYPNAILILGHMGGYFDNSKALDAVKEYDNIYGDTAWVPIDVVEKAESMGISHKIMFGTDSPLGDLENCYEYDCYKKYFACTDAYMKGVMADNAKRLFGLN